MTDIARSLFLAASRYDAAQDKRDAKHGLAPNVYRFGLILERLDRAQQARAAGASLARSLYDNFNDRLLTALERAAGVAVTCGGGARDTGRPL